MESKKQLFIPEKIKVGFQARTDTYTQKLAYVIYYDLKGVLRKEKSWESWRDDKIAPIEFTNEPTEGFVLNKGVGGQRQSYGWNARNEYIRVYDPRDFEFEISVSNLLFILRECDCSKGKGLEGKFVYAWDGTELVLLPECSTDYQSSKTYTQLQICGVKSKDLILGASYLTKKQDVLVYLGRFDFHSITYISSYKSRSQKSVCKKHVFWNGKDFEFMDGLKSIAVLNSDIVASNYAELVDKYYKSAHGSKIVEVFKAVPKNFSSEKYTGYWCADDTTPGVYLLCYSHYSYRDNTIDSVTTQYRITYKDGSFVCENFYRNSYPSQKNELSRYSRYDGYSNTLNRWIEPTNLSLYAKLESGSVFNVQGCSLEKER